LYTSENQKKELQMKIVLSAIIALFLLGCSQNEKTEAAQESNATQTTVEQTTQTVTEDAPAEANTTVEKNTTVEANATTEVNATTAE
jgi:PBP1b-binding outer membrane lipoprotein LpoB